MLLSSGVEKILVCAPSNAAIDEIILRCVKNGFEGCEAELQDQHQHAQHLVRIASKEYKPLKAVESILLDRRLRNQLIEQGTLKPSEEARLLLKRIKVVNHTLAELLSGKRMDA